MSWSRRFYKQHPIESIGLDRDLNWIVNNYISTLNIPRDANILDLGCGDGRVLKALRCIYPQWKLHGIDVSEQNVQKLYSEGFDVYLLDICEEPLPFDDGFFDIVLLFDVIEHLIDPDFVLTEISRVLKSKENSLLLIKMPNLAFWVNRILLVCGIQPLHTEVSRRRVLGRHFSFLGQGNQSVGHINVFTLSALSDILNLYSFSVENIIGFQDWRLPKILRLIDIVLINWPSLAGVVLVSCSKLPNR